ncbi:MAG: chemotaxis protein CheB [Terriglobales bacterium]
MRKGAPVPSPRSAGRPDALIPDGAPYQVIAVGASAGGFHSLCALLRPIPADLPCGILVVQHLSPDYKSILAELLNHRTALRVRQAKDGEPVVPGTVYIAPPDLHLLAEPGNVRLLRTPNVNHHRPSIDLLFESVAVNYGAHSIGIVLSGSGTDGARGLKAIKIAGGATVTEDPARAEFNSMPYAAVATGCVDFVLPLDKVGGLITRLCHPKTQ